MPKTINVIKDHQIDPYQKLAAWVLYRAWMDFRSGNGHSLDAWTFLVSPGCRTLMMLTGINPEFTQRLVKEELRTNPQLKRIPL